MSAPTDRARIFISDCPPGENARKIDNGSYLIDTIIYAKQKVHKDTRLNRIIRDIPEKSIVGGNKISNLTGNKL